MKFNSEFTPEKWELDDDLTFQQGMVNFQGAKC